MSRKICTVSVQYVLATTGLMGGDLERDPYVSTYATWGAHRMNTEDFLQELKTEKKPVKSSVTRDYYALGTPKEEEELREVKNITQARDVKYYASTRALAYELPDYDEHRSDDAIKLKLFAHTNFAGVPFLDKAEGAYVTRQMQEGLTHLELIDLFAQYRERAAKQRVGAEGLTWRIRDEFVDDKVALEKTRELAGTAELTDSLYAKHAPQARALTAKAQLVFQVTISEFREDLYARSVFATKDLKKTGLYARLDAQNRQLALSKKQGGSDGGAQFAALMYNSERSQLLMAQTMLSVLQLYCDSFIKLNEKHRPRYRPSEPVIQHLQLPMYIGENGRMPVARYFAYSEPFFKQYASAQAKTRELSLYAYGDRTESYLLMLLRSSLRRHGLSEATFVSAINEHFSPQNTSHQVTWQLQLSEEALLDVGTFLANSAYYTADYRLINEATHVHQADAACAKCGKKMSVRVFNTDSWDSTILNGTTMCDDCEGQDKTASSVVRAFKVGRQALGHTWKSEALQAYQLYLRHTYLWDVGSLVTSAFMNTDNTKMELQQKDELPLIGSAMDKNAQNDGHCFFVTKTRLSTSAQLVRDPRIAKHTKDRMRKDAHINDAFVAREKRRQMLVGEGTGSIEPRVLSLEESYGTESPLFRKKRAERAFARHTRAELKKDEALTAVAQLFNGEGLSHYVKKQDPQRRTSSFYNSVVHGVCPELQLEYGAELTQAAFCVERGRETCYGVRIGELVRDDAASKLSLVCPYAGQQELWAQQVTPMIETIENQMPVMRFGRYTEEEYTRVYSRYVAPTQVDEAYVFDAPGNKELAKKREAFETKLFALDAQPDLTVVRFYSRAWKLNKDPKARAAMMKFLQALPGLVEYGFFVEKHMPVLEPQVEILCIVNVTKALQLE